MGDFFSASDDAAYTPLPAPGFRPHRIVLARGSRTLPSRRTMTEQICQAYPEAEVVDQPEVPHNRVDLGETDATAALRLGKRTLVLGEHRSAVRQSREEGNTCPNYWHFSPYGFCPYGCHYCYLAGTPGVRFSPTVKVFLNLPEILAEIDRIAARLAEPTAFYLGKLQDGLALDPLTGYSRTLVRFFAAHRYARMVLLTKSASVENLLGLDHGGHAILSWSLNPTEMIAAFEAGTPPLAERVEAMKRCAAADYSVRFWPKSRWTASPLAASAPTARHGASWNTASGRQTPFRMPSIRTARRRTAGFATPRT
jgi:spore photoproduct lyase